MLSSLCYFEFIVNELKKYVKHVSIWALGNLLARQKQYSDSLSISSPANTQTQNEIKM